MRLRDGHRGRSRAARPRCLRSYTDTAQTMRLLTPELRAGRMRMPKAPGPNQCRGVLRGGRGRGRGSERGRRRERERERELLRERQEHGSGTATRGDSRAAARRGGDGAMIPLRRDAVRSAARPAALRRGPNLAVRCRWRAGSACRVRGCLVPWLGGAPSSPRLFCKGRTRSYTVNNKTNGRSRIVLHLKIIGR